MQNIKYRTVNLSEETEDLTNEKPCGFKFRNRTYWISRQAGWKKLLEEVVKLLYEINPKEFEEASYDGIEFLINYEPALWAINNRKPAENYSDDWWTKIADNVYIYNKNSTQRKLKNIRYFFELAGVPLSDLDIYIYDKK